MKCCCRLSTLGTLRRLASTTQHFTTTQHLTTRHFSATSASDKASTTHFGFETVGIDEKEPKVKEVFEKVADSYDLMNDVMSVGVHRLWKDYFASKVNPKPHFKCLDVAGGTGDIAFRLFNRMSKVHESPEQVVICDINTEMLEVGKKRAAELYGKSEVFQWVEGNAECLPFDNDSFDVFTIAYGIRNVTHINKALSEAYRVLKPGGKFMCLEFSSVQNEIVSQVYNTYSFEVIPVLGQLVANDYESYKYLVESIKKFPDQEKFADMIRDAGFQEVGYENLTFGVTAIHTGFKLPQEWDMD